MALATDVHKYVTRAQTLHNAEDLLKSMEHIKETKPHRDYGGGVVKSPVQISKSTAPCADVTVDSREQMRVPLTQTNSSSSQSGTKVKPATRVDTRILTAEHCNSSWNIQSLGFAIVCVFLALHFFDLARYMLGF